MRLNEAFNVLSDKTKVLGDAFKIFSFNTWILPFYPFIMLTIRYWRKKAICMLNFRPGDQIIIPGVGSGHDLPFLPKDVKVEGVDISEAMLGIAEAKIRVYGIEKNVNLREMDAEKLDYSDNSFDKAILSLTLTCVYHPKKAFSEAVRVVKPGGEILIYDHLLRRGTIPPVLLKIPDIILRYNFASFTRVYEDITEGQPITLMKVIHGDPIGYVKGFLLRKSS